MSLKLQKKSNRNVGDKEYFKWYVPISPEFIEELNWEKGDSLKAKVSGKKLVIEKE